MLSMSRLGHSQVTAIVSYQTEHSGAEQETRYPVGLVTDLVFSYFVKLQDPVVSGARAEVRQAIAGMPVCLLDLAFFASFGACRLLAPPSDTSLCLMQSMQQIERGARKPTSPASPVMRGVSVHSPLLA